MKVEYGEGETFEDLINNTKSDLLWINGKKVEEAREWWRKNWKKAEDFGNAFCEWYVDGVSQSVEKSLELCGQWEEECES